jgi:hypothetical protein
MSTLAEAVRNDDAVKIERLEGAMLALPQVECPVDHFFASGVYVRQMTAPAGTLIVGHEHKTEHVCILLKGSMTIATPEGVRTVSAPLTFIAPPGRKVAVVLEDIVFQNIHATEERDLDKIEAQIITKSETWNDAHALVERLRDHELSDRSAPWVG